MTGWTCNISSISEREQQGQYAVAAVDQKGEDNNKSN
jgi:hypothetical protein